MSARQRPLQLPRVRGWIFSVTLLCSAALSGCFTAPRFAPSGILQDAAESRRQCEWAQRASPGVESFRALLDATVVDPRGDTHSFRYAVVARGAGDLRVDLLPQEGAYTLGLLVVRDGEALCIDPNSKRFVQGCEPDAIFERFFGLEGITPDVVRALITAHVPKISCDAVQTYQTRGGEIQLVETTTPRAWTLDYATGRVRQVAVLDESGSSVLAKAEIPHGAGDSIVIEIFKPVPAHATLNIARFVSNPKIADTLFVVPIPADYERDRC
jgi:hypothetical protein